MKKPTPHLVMEESSSSKMSSSFAMFSLTTISPFGVRAAIARLMNAMKSSGKMKCCSIRTSAMAYMPQYKDLRYGIYAAV